MGELVKENSGKLWDGHDGFSFPSNTCFGLMHISISIPIPISFKMLPLHSQPILGIEIEIANLRKCTLFMQNGVENESTTCCDLFIK